MGESFLWTRYQEGTSISYEYDKKEINPDRDFYRQENKYISKKKNKTKAEVKPENSIMDEIALVALLVVSVFWFVSNFGIGEQLVELSVEFSLVFLACLLTLLLFLC